MSQSGIIRRINLSGYGFIRSEADEKDYFFHPTQTHYDWSKLRPGDRVTFDAIMLSGKLRAVNVKKVEVSHDKDGNLANNDVPAMPLPRVRTTKTVAPYDGETLNLSSEQRKQALEEISRWKLEARLDDVKRYFYVVPELNNITSGDASYVIGRKGTGKTALVQHLSNSTQSELMVAKLTFKNFPFNELYGHTNDGFRRPNQYITLWKLIIYSAACRLMAQSRYIDPLVKQTIDKAFPQPDSDNLGTIIGRWIAGDISVNLLGTGFSLSKWFKEKKTYSLQEKVENIENFVKKNLPRGKFLILFDELDEDYKEMFETYKKSEYLDLLTSLFKAVQDVRSTFREEISQLYPVIFLRDDIYDLIQDADKNKWRDLEVDITWNDLEIRKLLAHRLAKALLRDEERFDVLWYSIFDLTPLVYSGGYKEIHSFSYIKMSAQGRPRDYINYLQECASIELSRSSSIISADTIRDADKAYSNYLKKELIDEIHGLIPDISRVLSIFSELRKWILSIDEFRKAYQERVSAGGMAVVDADFVLRTLFYFSVIGNVVRTDLHVFRHERPDAQLNFKEKIVVHRGLMKALQIL